MCGYAATAVVLTAARELGSTQTELVRYATSGEINGRHAGSRGICRRCNLLRDLILGQQYRPQRPAF